MPERVVPVAGKDSGCSCHTPNPHVTDCAALRMPDCWDALIPGFVESSGLGTLGTAAGLHFVTLGGCERTPALTNGKGPEGWFQSTSPAACRGSLKVSPDEGHGR